MPGNLTLQADITAPKLPAAPYCDASDYAVCSFITAQLGFSHDGVFTQQAVRSPTQRSPMMMVC
jgi:hypothetical protein